MTSTFGADDLKRCQASETRVLLTRQRHVRLTRAREGQSTSPLDPVRPAVYAYADV